jgi:hypothetical protein
MLDLWIWTVVEKATAVWRWAGEIWVKWVWVGVDGRRVLGDVCFELPWSGVLVYCVGKYHYWEVGQFWEDEVAG